VSREDLIRYCCSELQGLAQRILVEARKCAPATAADSLRDRRRLVDMAYEQAEQLASRFNITLRQESIGHDYTPLQWHEELYRHKRRFINEMFRIAIDIMDGK
jgi:hypothetical protein